MFMHESEDRGRLVWSGKPMTNSGIARLLGLSERESVDAISVLLDAGVASRDESGAIICRRMVRENQISQARKESACKRWCKTDAKHHAKPMQNTDIDIDSLNVFNGKKKAASLEEVLQFCREIRLTRADAEWFWHKCEGNGWTNGGQRIRDWRQTLRSWKAGGYVPSIKNPEKGKPPRPRTEQPRKTEEPVATPTMDSAKEAEFQKRLQKWKDAGRPLEGFPT